MKWLIWGARGWIGEMVCKLLRDDGDEVVEATSRADDEDTVFYEIDRVKPDRMMCFIGRTHGGGYSTIDYLEQKGSLQINVRDNLYAPLCLAMMAKKCGVHFTYLGTGCIFEYENLDTAAVSSSDEIPELYDGFKPESKPNFFGSSYSTVKGFTDRLMHILDEKLGAPVLNARIRMPIVSYHNERNLITKLTKYAKICSVPNSMTILDEMLPVLIKYAREERTGTVNLVNPGVITHNEILELYKQYVDPSFTYINFTLEDQAKILAGGRSNNYLEANFDESLNVSNIEDGVRRVMERWRR